MKTIKNDERGRWLIFNNGKFDRFNFFSNRKDAEEFVKSEGLRVYAMRSEPTDGESHRTGPSRRVTI